MRVNYGWKAILQIHTACEQKESRLTVSLQNLDSGYEKTFNSLIVLET